MKKRLPLFTATFFQLFAIALAAWTTFHHVQNQGRIDLIVTVAIALGGIGTILCLAATWWLDLTKRVSKWFFLGAPLLCNFWAMLIPYIFGREFFNEVEVHNHFGFPVDWFFYVDALRIVEGQSIALIWASTAFFGVAMVSKLTLWHHFEFLAPRFFRSWTTYCSWVFGVVLFGVMILANRPFEIESVSSYFGHWLSTLFYPQQGGGLVAWRQLMWVVFLFTFFFGQLFVPSKFSVSKEARDYRTVSFMAMFGLLICLFDAGRSMFAASVMHSIVDPLRSSLTWVVLGETPWFVYSTIFHVAALLTIALAAIGVLLLRIHRQGDGLHIKTIVLGAVLFLLPVAGREVWGMAALRAAAGDYNADTELGDVGRFAARVPITFYNEPGQPIFSLYGKNIDLPKAEYGLGALELTETSVFLSMVDSQIYVNQNHVSRIEVLPKALREARVALRSHVQRHPRQQNLDDFRLRPVYELDGALEYQPAGTVYLLAETKTPAIRIREIFETCAKEHLEVRLVGLSQSNRKDIWYIQRATQPLHFARVTSQKKHSGLTHFRFEGVKVHVDRITSGNTTTTLQKLKEEHESSDQPRGEVVRLISFSNDVTYQQLLDGISFLNEGFGMVNIQLWVDLNQ